MTQNRHQWRYGTFMLFPFNSLRCLWCWLDTLCTRCGIHHVHRFVSCASGPLGRVSNRPNQMRGFSFAPHFVVSQASLHVAVHVQPCRGKAFGCAQLQCGQAAASLKSDNITALALDPGSSHPVQACASISGRLVAEINDLRTSATVHAVFMLLPAFVLTRKRVSQVFSVWDPVASQKKKKRLLISRSSLEDTRCIASSRPHCQPHQHFTNANHSQPF